MTLDQEFRECLLRRSKETGLSPREIIEAALNALARRGQITVKVDEAGETRYFPRDPS